MKSMPILIVAAAVAIACAASASQRWSGSQVLVSSVISPQTWVRTCTYSLAEGLKAMEVDASVTCPSTPFASFGAANQQARVN
jgi:hypothetical protein